MTLAEQLACVEIEIGRRDFWRRSYGLMGSQSIQTIHVEDGHELACMRAVEETLRGLLYAHIGDIKTEKFGDGAPNDR